MTSNYALDALIAVLVLGWIVYRQSQWQTVDLTRIWRGPLILGIAAVAVMSQSGTGASQFSAAAVVILIFEAVLAVSVGVGMGLLSQFARDSAGELQVRTSLTGSMLWIVLIAVRIGMDVVGVHMGATVVASAGAIIAMLALNRMGRTAVIAMRAQEFTDAQSVGTRGPSPRDTFAAH